MSAAGSVAGVWRHPVKSLQGQPVSSAVITARGLVGDRDWGVRDVATGALLSAKREPRLLLASATTAGEGLVVRLPGGGPLTGRAADRALSDLLGRPVVIDRAPAIGPAYVDAAPLHLLTVAALGSWDVRRFRPNLVLDGGLDLDELAGTRLAIGGLVVEVTKRTKRCGMTTAEQPELAKDVGVLRTLARERDLRLGVYADVVTAGTVAVGDPVRLLGESSRISA